MKIKHVLRTSLLTHNAALILHECTFMCTVIYSFLNSDWSKVSVWIYLTVSKFHQHHCYNTLLCETAVISFFVLCTRAVNIARALQPVHFLRCISGWCCARPACLRYINLIGKTYISRKQVCKYIDGSLTYYKLKVLMFKKPLTIYIYTYLKSCEDHLICEYGIRSPIWHHTSNWRKRIQ